MMFSRHVLEVQYFFLTKYCVLNKARLWKRCSCFRYASALALFSWLLCDCYVADRLDLSKRLKMLSFLFSLKHRQMCWVHGTAGEQQLPIPENIKKENEKCKSFDILNTDFSVLPVLYTTSHNGLKIALTQHFISCYSSWTSLLFLCIGKKIFFNSTD